jgi:sulfonate transport system substrate-binding protein
VRAEDGFDLRFGAVVDEAVPAAGASFGPEVAVR